MAIAVIRFPGTNNEQDILQALSLVPGADPFLVSSNEGPAALTRADGVVIPGGFSYGDYLRVGAVAAVSEILEGIRTLAEEDKPVLGICNGFQILVEAGLLPGTLLPNESAKFICRWVHLRVCDVASIFTDGLEGLVLRIPIAHADGNYYTDADKLKQLKIEGRIPFRYCTSEGEMIPSANPNGSVENIAGVANSKGNVLGMMPHPERASRAILGSEDGLIVLENLVRASKGA